MNKRCSCGKLLSRATVYRGKDKCLSCARKGSGNAMFGKKRPDVTIYNKIHTKHGKNAGAYKGGKPHCKNCDCVLIDYRSKICPNCYHKSLKGKGNPRFGKLASHGKGMYYKDIWMRSSYEIAYAKYLDSLGIIWQYEPKTFDLGNCTYTPDFYIPTIDIYIEIKGWWRPDALQKFKLFRKQYPKLCILIFTKEELKTIGAL